MVPEQIVELPEVNVTLAVGWGVTPTEKVAALEHPKVFVTVTE